MPEGRYEQVMFRDHGECQARTWGLDHRCSGPLTVHHLRNRGMGGAATSDNDLDNLLVVCDWANHWIAEHPRDAEALGLYRRH